jgi:hypothetical protein
MLGGIESTTKAFTGGLDKEALDNSTTDEIRAISAKDYVSFGNKKYYDPNESEHWVVDFEGVASGFLFVPTIISCFLSLTVIALTGFHICFRWLIKPRSNCTVQSFATF